MNKPKRCPSCGRRERRSNPQNSLYWLLVHEIATRVAMFGRMFSPDTWHLYFRREFIGVDEYRLPNGKTESIPISTTTLDVAEFSDYFTKVEAFAAERGVWLADRETA